MTKKDIILKVADESGLKQTDVKIIVQKTFDYMVEALVRGERSNCATSAFSRSRNAKAAPAGIHAPAK
jgi:nucleoid DNA-binding protein